MEECGSGSLRSPPEVLGLLEVLVSLIQATWVISRSVLAPTSGDGNRLTIASY
jgi:hypothetical protein